ncbi:MAG: ComEA family DNA-binding protein [Propionibacteriales bacterium]|nr:ComEA family DNA-binding protein [Propionibacteriales bacterium]
MFTRKPSSDPEARAAALRRLALVDPAPTSPEDLASTSLDDRAPAPAGDLASAPSGRHASARLSMLSRLLGRVEDAMPPTFRGRLGVTSQHITVVALVLTAAMALAAWLVIQSKPQPVTPPQPASIEVPAGASSGGRSGEAASVPTGGSEPTPTGGRSGRLIVDVAGKVRKPGIARLPAGSRVVDALKAAGGAKPGVDLTTLNLARPLVDGEQILVGVRASPAPATSPLSPDAGLLPTEPSTPVNLNTASQAELEELPGVGPVTAASIIKWRTEHGGFSVVEELLEVSGIGDVTLAELRDLVTV